MVSNPPVKRILFLAANPHDTTRLRLDEEMREIRDALRPVLLQGRFVIEQVWATRPRDLLQAIVEFKPHIVHFSGHGKGRERQDDGRSENNTDERVVAFAPEMNVVQEGLIFEDDNGYSQLVDAEALAKLFELCSDHVECIVLNGCFSAPQAEAIAQYIPYVIGMKKAIGDEAAINFARGFYLALGNEQLIEKAYQFGCSSIQLRAKEYLTPKLIKKNAKAPPDKGESTNIKLSRRQTIYLFFAASAAMSTPLLPKIVKFVQRNFQLSTFEFEVVTVNNQGRINERNLKTTSLFIENLENGIDLEMVAIPQGEFYMGASETEASLYNAIPKHLVKIAPFFMSKHPITQAQWRAVTKLPKITLDLDPDPSEYFKGSDLPVQWISWYEAFEFCERLSKKTGRKYRLPSEAEWEYACRAGTTTPYHFGEILTPQLANYDSDPPNDRKGTTEVGSFQVANAFGLYDMHGNVWEWCADYWHENYEGAPSDGTAWVSGGNDQARVLRGGSWAYPMENCRSAHRGNDGPGRQGVTNDTGFRVVCSEI